MTKITWITAVNVLLISSPMAKQPIALGVFMPNQKAETPQAFSPQCPPE
jgi:hypothetical protein